MAHARRFWTLKIRLENKEQRGYPVSNGIAHPVSRFLCSAGLFSDLPPRPGLKLEIVAGDCKM